jgi:outer membrane lipoprotein-sorting protein
MMPRRRVRALILLVCVSALDFSGCFVRRRIITRKGGNATPVLLTADKQTLIDRLAQAYQAIQSFSATVDMVPALGSSEKSKITEYKDVRGYILFRKPADIRIIGLYPVVRNKAFDMVSNGKDFRLYLPSSNRFVTGSNQLIANSKNKIENLRPQHFLEALLAAPMQSGEKAELMNFTDEDNAVYVLHFVRVEADGQILPTRSIWFSRINLHIARQLVYDPAGNILTDARYSDYQNYDGTPFPKTIDIDRPQDEYAVVLTVVKMEINRGISDDKFVLEQPEGTVLQVLGQPGPTPPPAPAPPAKGKKKKP